MQVLLEEGFLVASAETLPFGWAPRRRFLSADLADAWTCLAAAWQAGPDMSAEAKNMILSTIGLWTKQERLAWHAKRTSYESNLPGQVLVTSFRPDGSTIQMCATELHDNRTMLPVALLCLFDEQRRTHRARQLVAKVPQIVPLGVQVDGLFYTGPPEADLALRKLAAAEHYEHSDASVYHFKAATWRQVPQCKQLDGANRECFKPRVRQKWDNSLSERNLEQSMAQVLESDPESQEMKQIFDGFVAKAEGLPPLSNVSFGIATNAIFNHGMLCLGPAGTGKSIKAILEGFEQKVRVCAYTHCACRLVGGETVAHLLHLNTSLSDTWFLVDEVGLLPVSTLGAMSRWMELGARFIFFGDYAGQFEPFRDRWDMSANDGRNSPMHQMCHGLRITLQTYRRGADPELFEWFHGLYGQQDARGLAEESRARYPAECDPNCNPQILCLSHKKRMLINALQNTRLKPEGALLCEWQGEENLCGAKMQPQDMFVWVGLELIGCPRGSGRHLTVQGVIYIVSGITDTHLELRMRPEYCRGAEDEHALVPLDEACTQLRLCHAMCYYTCQGRTIRDRHIVLLDARHKHFSV